MFELALILAALVQIPSLDLTPADVGRVWERQARGEAPPRVTIASHFPPGVQTPSWLRQEGHWNEGALSGVNCLYLIAQLTGRETSYDSVRLAVAPGPRGTSIQALAEAARELGVHSRLESLDPRETARLDPPFIAQIRPDAPKWHGSSFIVVLSRRPDGGEYLVVDGASGVLSPLDPVDLYRLASGTILQPAGKLTRTGADLQKYFLIATMALAAMLLGLSFWSRRSNGSASRADASGQVP